MELVGEWLGFDQDSRVSWYFREHPAGAFPALRTPHRTTFVRQAASRWRVKQLLQQRLAAGFAEPLWLVDSLPAYACQFGRAKFCRRFRGHAASGYGHTKRQTF